MKAARQEADDERTAEPAHRPDQEHRASWWLPVVLVPIAVLTVLCVRDALGWIGRPFAGFLFLDNRIVVSLGRATWRAPALRRVEWGLVTAVDGTTVRSAADVHAAVARSPVGAERTYTLRRGAEVFRVGLPVARFGGGDFATVFAPMLATGAWTGAIGAALLAVHPGVATLRALFVMCVCVGLMMITGPDQYGPYRFVWVFYLALAVIPASVFHMTASFLWWPGVWTRRVVAAVYAIFVAVGIVLAARRFDPAVFLPLLYLVYFALANALVVHLGTLVSAFASRPHLRPTLGLAIAGVFAPAFVPIVVFVTYPLWTEPVTVPWLVVPVGLGPLMHGIALAKLAAPAGDLAGERP